ncbi:MAG: hypothetical protein ACD_81C00145G0001 [uncultured bacterium]|uniref:RNA-metabolising metallo-beta-lactamase n=2 Tax=Candidatus Wolfeibacteriota TaxID=1752735 RepID=A0A0G1H8Y5_9BACT|nr:MAG: hypothetical protein ACD_81C00145G0001 [uncultured bacterium]KKR12342.1 MAG: RNA-metabolising metallo-beta-lactamase [Candidatus Wolfebacteria bacterium GW2011_GWC2_39_22]KKT43250.1 MAG: RNA-metabolising metallo-beta-lactamase [Candidatus Wolfebacteria bacterium GW2011_GWE2_44_13]HBI25969.1 MBL fold hydrolase [Candidatus Wolfebacteria bacterium]
MELTFFGASEEVTGSNFLLETPNTKILIDCGLIQGGRFVNPENYEPFPYDVKNIDALFVTHAHIDHTGKIPKLYKEGFRGKIYSTSPTKDFAEQLLVDSEHLLYKDSLEQGRAPIYDLNDITATLKMWEGISYHQKIDMKDFSVEFFDAGHILGSAFIVVTEKATGKSVAFSGDLGNQPAPLVKDTEQLADVDYLLIESTYGDRVHDNPGTRRDRLEDVIEDAMMLNGVLLIPAFAMERTQELLYEMDELVEKGRIPGAPVYVDSPLAIKLTALYKKYSQDPMYFDAEAIEKAKQGGEIFDFPRLRFTLTSEQSKSINEASLPKIIIAGSGMSNGGRILHHELRYLPDPNTTILFIGYQARGTMGRAILDGAPVVRIMGEEIPVRCKMATISGYSAHADQPLLLQWIHPMRQSLKKIFVVHGDVDQMTPFAQKVRDEFAIDTIIPKHGMKVTLD